MFDLSYFTSWFTLERALLALLILAAFFIFSKLSQYKLVPLFVKLARRLKSDLVCDLLAAVNRPLATFWLVLGAQFALTQLLGLQTLVLPLGFRIGYLLLGAWAACRAADVLPVLTRRHDKNAESIKKLTRISLKGLIASFTAVIVLGEFGYNVNGLITGLGLGGLTLSLAAKDSASNLFSGILLLVERPFEVGDWITCAAAEGTVEDISLRSTRIRTFANTLSVVPNSLICSAPLTNVTRMKMRMKKFTIGVCYDTPRDRLEAVLADLRALLKNDADLVDGTFEVRLCDFAESSIDIMVLYYTHTTEYKKWLVITERINLEILDIVRRDGVSFAFPSRSIYLENTAN